MVFTPLLIFRFVESERQEKLSKIVDDLHPTEDREAGEEPHGATDEPQRRLSCHLHIFLNFIIGCCGQVDLDKLDWMVKDILF